MKRELHNLRKVWDGAARSGRAIPAFTLIELLVVVAIIAVLIGVLIPSLAAARRKAITVMCMSNLRQVAIGTQMYLDDNQGAFWRYYETSPDGRLWWFGLEPGGPGSGTHRPLDKTRGVITRYLNTTDEHLQCPAFDHADAMYYPKFAQPAATYGYNLRLGPAVAGAPTQSRSSYVREMATVFVFADAIHFDFGPTYNEGHYVQFAANASFATGYGHFRHDGQAFMAMMDGHVEGQPLAGKAFRETGGGPAGNLTARDGGSAVYGK
jgi:prepilin-type N-terminal cleavage/methylation domain-containing protein/prepilin-type processing-associated H-X9-DG protein